MATCSHHKRLLLCYKQKKKEASLVLQKKKKEASLKLEVVVESGQDLLPFSRVGSSSLSFCYPETSTFFVFIFIH